MICVPVARRDEGHLLAHGRPTTAAIASTMLAAAVVPRQLGRAALPERDRAWRADGRRCRPGAGRRRRRTGSAAARTSGGIGHRVRHGARAAGHDGHPGHHRLDERHSESLVRRQREVDVGGSEVGGERRVRHLAGAGGPRPSARGRRRTRAAPWCTRSSTCPRRGAGGPRRRRGGGRPTAP